MTRTKIFALYFQIKQKVTVMRSSKNFSLVQGGGCSRDDYVCRGGGGVRRSFSIFLLCGFKKSSIDPRIMVIVICNTYQNEQKSFSLRTKESNKVGIKFSYRELWCLRRFIRKHITKLAYIVYSMLVHVH